MLSGIHSNHCGSGIASPKVGSKRRMGGVTKTEIGRYLGEPKGGHNSQKGGS